MRSLNRAKALVIIVFTTLLAACASTPQPTVSLTSNAPGFQDKKIGYFYVAPEDKATTHIFGAGCLLCYGVASALTNSLDNHLETTIGEAELVNLSQLVMTEYAQSAPLISPVKLSKNIKDLPKFKGELGFAKKDFRVLKEELNVDVLVVFTLYRHGAYRSFTNYIPNGDPKGHLAGLLYAVDLETNAYLQYLELDEQVQPEGEWDEPPTFPNVTTSYYQAIENVKAKISSAI